MQHLFLTPQLSQQAKIKGFTDPCFGFYTMSKDVMKVERLRNNALHVNSDLGRISAPLYQQIIHWLFNKGFYLDDQWLPHERLWICDLRNRSGDLIWEDPVKDPILSLEQAWERAIEKALHFMT